MSIRDRSLRRVDRVWKKNYYKVTRDDMVNLLGRVLNSLEIEGQECVVDLKYSVGFSCLDRGMEMAPSWVSQAWVLSGWCKQGSIDRPEVLGYQQNGIKVWTMEFKLNW